jgi:alpha-tubulin suppressor-like RCC1 family protein
MLAPAVLAGGCVPRKNKPPPMRLVALGADHGCGQLAGQSSGQAGQVVCWGSNTAGQIGDGTREARPFQTKVSGELGPLRSFGLGLSHGCAIDMAGALSCWGDNAFGQLGVAGPDARATPTRVSGDGFDLVSAGSFHTCARGRDGVRCWGQTLSFVAINPSKASPFEPAVTRGARVTALAAGGSATCFALERGEAPAGRQVHCFGTVLMATALASGAGGERVMNEGLPALQGVAVTQLATNDATTCAVAASGELFCWGSTAGLRRLAAEQPTRVDLPEAAVEVHLGAEHACVRTRSGTVACWGDNSAHQLADGTRTPSDRPKLIYGLVGAQQLAVSSRGACALVDRGEVRCWGGNLHGELGDGTTVEHDVPMPIKAAPR